MGWLTWQRASFIVLATAMLIVLATFVLLSLRKPVPLPCVTRQIVNQKGSSEELGSTKQPSTVIFMITPTYDRPTRVPDLTRLCQTVMHVKHFYWIVVEDNKDLSEDVKDILDWCSVNSTYLALQTPPKHQEGRRGRGADQRNTGLQWLRQEYKVGQLQGVVYFGDDDNTYDVRLFEEMRYTRKVSIWPVAFAGDVRKESPVCEGGKLIGFSTAWKRKFAVDMAGFAVNLDLILRKHNEFKAPVGSLETDFLDQLITPKELEPKANCTKVYVWHTKTQAPTIDRTATVHKI